ncbi:hypothetical protein HOY81_23065, partial [Streptomyces sp. JJ36]|nr:hypothetical protein [Streptomyces sp. JJ36]
MGGHTAVRGPSAVGGRIAALHRPTAVGLPGVGLLTVGGAGVERRTAVRGAPVAGGGASGGVRGRGQRAGPRGGRGRPGLDGARVTAGGGPLRPGLLLR